MKKKHLIILYFFVFHLMNGQNLDFNNLPRIKYYTLKDGLSQASINDLLLDKDGFVWISTQDGLNRFDGNVFKKFNHIESDITTISGRFISKLFEDKTCKIWVGTIGNGLNYYDKNEEQFKRIKLINSKNNSEIISDIIEDKKGNIWISSRISGLHKLTSIKNNAFEQKNYLPNNNLSALFFDRKENLWIGDFEGNIYSFNQKRANSLIKEIKVKGHIRSFYELDKKLLIGSDFGLYMYDMQTKKIKMIELEESKKMSAKYISSFLKVTESKVWIGTGNGIYLFDWVEQKVIKKIVYSDDTKSLSNNSVQSLLKLTPHKILVGTATYLNLLDFEKPYFKNISKNKKGLHLLNDNVIFSIFKDKNDLWVGTSNGGLNLIRNNKTYQFLININEKSKSITSPVIRAIVKDENNDRLWLGSTRGLFMIDLKTFDVNKPKFKIFKHDPNNKNSISADYLKDITLDKNNNIWGATFGQGVFCMKLFNNDKVKIVRFKNEVKKINSLSNNFTYCIRSDSESNIWIGSQKGLTKLSFNDETYKNPVFENYSKDTNNPTSLSDDTIYDILIDKNNSVWLATRNGLNLFLGNGKFQSWLEQKQFSNAIVYSIQDDSEANLWLGTNNGLVNFNVKTKTFTQYNVDDGIQDREFNLHAKFRDLDGNVYLGGIGGITYFDANLIENIDKPKMLYFSQLQIKHKVITPNSVNFRTLKNAIFNTSEIQLNYNHFPFYLDFSSINYSFETHNKYAFKLLPIDEGWNELKSTNIQFHNLPIGEYTLKVNGFSRGKEWQKKPLEMKIIVLPPWWKSSWAYLFYFLLFMMFLVLIFALYFKRIKRINEVNKKKELEKLKTKMYANISHEFRTPLTVINGLSEILISENNVNNNKNLVKLKGILFSSKQLLKLVNQMLNLVSFDANKINANYKNGDVVKFIKKCISFYKFYADSKEQELDFISNLTSLNMDFDDDKLQKIINNVLSNALKFTPKYGKVTVELFKHNDDINILIKDTGQGIHPDHLPHVFDRYYKTFDKNLNLGSGIGMALTKEFVELLNGKITVSSIFNEGAIFKIELPIKNVSNKTKIAYKMPLLKNENIVDLSQTVSNDFEKQYSILIVEDNAIVQKLIKSILNPIYITYVANNGVRGLEIAMNNKIDLIISDVMMPNMNGFEFCKRIKNNIITSHLPFIILSAKVETNDKLKGHKLGIDAYLIKPFNKDELLLIIKNLLYKKQGQINYFSKLLNLKKSYNAKDINKLDLDLIVSIQDQILNNNRKIIIDELAKELLTSRTQLHRKIKALTGMSITNYINYIRIEKAKVLLQKTSLNSSEIAYEVGFESATYFSRIFKKELGISPMTFKNNQE